MLVGPSDDIIESKIVTGPILKLQRGGSSPLSPMLATPLDGMHKISATQLKDMYRDVGYICYYCSMPSSLCNKIVFL